VCSVTAKPVLWEVNTILIHIYIEKVCTCCLTCSVAGELDEGVWGRGMHAVLGMRYRASMHAVLRDAYSGICHAVNVNRANACGRYMNRYMNGPQNSYIPK